MKKIISILMIVIMLVGSIEVYASQARVECTAETVDGVSYISGKIQDVTGIFKVTLLVVDGDDISEDTILYINQTSTNANGEFNFAFRFPGGTPAGTYNYRIATNANTDLYEGTIEHTDPMDCMINQFINADLAINISGYVPTISGSISCTEGKTVSIDVLNKTDNVVIAEKLIVAEDGVTEVLYTLPNLLSPKEYELEILCTEDGKKVMRAYATIKSSGIMIEATGGILPANNVEVDMQLKTEGIDLVNHNERITESKTFTGNIPNIVMNGSVNLDIQGYEIVWIAGADTDDSEDEEPAETVIAKEISGGFEKQDEIKEVENNSGNGLRKIVDNCYSGKFALEIKQKKSEVIPIVESNYFYVGNVSVRTGTYVEKANLITAKVKPMYKAETISFYTKAKVNLDGQIKEEYVLIKSDKDGDGVFEVGEDLSLGKWQEIELDLETIEESPVNKSVSGLYMKANVNSLWLFDEIDSDYRKINTTELDLSKFAKGNVVYNGGLRFGATSGVYNTEPTIVTSGVDIDGELHNITVDSHIQSNGQLDENETEMKAETNELLLDASFSAENWIVNDTNYESTSSGVSKVTNDGILLKRKASADFVAGTFATEERVKIAANLSYVNTIPSDAQMFKIELYENTATEPYYYFTRTIEKPTRAFQITGIIPKIRENTYFKISAISDSGTEVRIDSIKVYSVCKNDWNSMDKYSTRLKVATFSSNDYLERKNVNELPGYIGNESAIVTKSLSGVVITESGYTKSISCEDGGSDVMLVIRMVNLSSTEHTVTIKDGSTIKSEHTLPYGEYDIVAKYYDTISLPVDPNVMLVSVCYFSKTNTNGSSYYGLIEGINDNCIISFNGNNIYYRNYLDGNSIYKYDITKKESTKITDSVTTIHCVSNDERYIVYTIGSKEYIYDVKNSTATQIPGGEKYSFNARGELFYISENDKNSHCYRYELYRYANGISEMLSYGRSYAFDSSGNHILISRNEDSNKVYEYYLYKYYNGSYTLIESYNPSQYYDADYLSDDLSKFYTSKGIAIDIKTGTKKESIGSIKYKASDNTFIVGSSLYNPATGEKYNITDATGDVVHYNPDTGMLTLIKDGRIARCKFNAEKSSAKYLLSFDGKNTWQSYKNGRWISVSKGGVPTESEIGALGMTGDELNNISPASYKKLYTNGTDILGVDVAIYMNSTSNKLTPVIDKITVSTSENVSIRQMFSVRRETYSKAEYANVTSIFPVEDFKEASECYYLFHIGKDNLYTYKGNELVKITETEEELLSNIEYTWIKFKQYAMSAKEVRNIPADVLTNLFVNPESEHAEFGVIYALKGENNDANTVTFKIQANAKHINSEETVIEVMMNGGDKKVVDSREFSTESIEKFLSWLEDRQSGRGAAFYIFKNSDVQFFINYYMIDSINVYDAEKYIADDTDEQTAVVSE